MSTRTIWQKVVLLKRVERMANWNIMLSRQVGVVNRGLWSLGGGRLKFFLIPRTITAACGEWIYIIWMKEDSKFSMSEFASKASNLTCFASGKFLFFFFYYVGWGSNYFFSHPLKKICKDNFLKLRVITQT